MSLRVADHVRPLRRTLIREIFESAPAEAINLGLGQPDLEAPPALRAALAAAAEHGPGGYGPTAGLEALREEIAADYPDLGLGSSDVLVTAGCQQATFVTLGCLLDPGDEILVPDPGFPGAERAAVAWSARARGYPLPEERNFHLDPEQVEALITPRTRAVVVISPSNPVGTVESAGTIQALVDLSARAGVALILDDTYRDLCWTAPRAPGIATVLPDHVVICGGLSKSLALTGWRVGWALCRNPAFMARLVALQQTVLTCASTPIQIGARAAFTAEGRRGRDRLVERFRRRRERVTSLLPPACRRAPMEGAFYAWIHAGGAGSRELARQLLEEDGVVVIPGEAFGPGGDGWIRVSYARREEELEKALERIALRLEAGDR
ncbi:MAG: pyridoxal phosphate-dependent aminotransferase [Acidobacteriota bacterium]|nr:pyridoxal phosphate-dependent aminotransferase [Acidobacteriota bacterium]